MNTKIKHLLVILVGLPFMGYSAKAPDFTVTDYNNKVHQLYADYLNKDKVIVIKFFFIGCPPCATIAPYVQQAYSRWNFGNSEVEFLQVSTIKSDMNSGVKSYSQNKGLTFPGVGFDGGAQTIYDQYRSGNFGPWYGTPTFVVIAPNGEVDYNVNMSAGNPYGLDTAIARALRLNNNGGGGGNECTRKFEVQTLTQVKPLGYYVVDFVNGASSQEIVDGKYNCEFQLPQNLNGLYVTAFTNLYIEPQTNITTADIVHIQRHILNLKPFNNLQYAIADVNRSSVVTAADVSDMRKLILGVTDKFPKLSDSYAIVHDPKSKDRFKISNKVLLSKLLDSTEVNEFGVGQYGDVSNAILLHDGGLIIRSDKKIYLYTKVSALPDGRFEHQVFSSQSMSVDAFQLSFDNLSGQITDVLLSGSMAEQFEIEYAINDFQLKVIVLNNSGNSCIVAPGIKLFSLISNDKKPIQLAQNTSFNQEFVLNDDEVIHEIKLENKTNYLHNNLIYFNPGNNLLYIHSDKKPISINVYDVLGRPVDYNRIDDTSYKIAGHHNGMFLIQLQYADNTTSVQSCFFQKK